MSYKNISFQFLARFTLTFFIVNVITPTLEYTFADSTNYYVDASSGSDLANGLTPLTAWQTLSRVNSEILLKGDTISLLCGKSWSGETLSIDESGNVGLPITYNSYSSGACLAKPILGGVVGSNISYITLNALNIASSSTGTAISLFTTGSNIQILSSDISSLGGDCLNITATSTINISNNTFSSCARGMSGSNISGNISNNTFSNLTEDAVTVGSSGALTLSNNTFSNLTRGAIVYGEATTVSQNIITNVCTGNSPSCAAIKNRAVTLGTLSTASLSENIIKNVGTGIQKNNYGISIKNVNGTTVMNNTVNNAEEALNIVNAKNLNINNNNLLLSRTRGVTVSQNVAGATMNNAFTSNTLLEKNPDYPYIEMRDDVIGGALATMLTPSGMNFYPLYKPNTSYVRSVKYGGKTIEYSKKELTSFDATVTKFEYFAYKPYTNTGVLAANLLSNSTFDTDASLWTASADIGSAPVLSYNPSGSYSGGSLVVTPVAGSPDRMWVTNDAVLTVSAGQNYEIKGYAKSASGNINLGAFLHSSSDKNIVYSDRIAETYASASGRIFSFYLSIGTGAVDAQLSLETSNTDVSYEIDSVTMRRTNPLLRNNTANEVLVFSNTGSTSMNQLCPGGTPCSAYVDGLGANIPSWSSSPVSISGYRTFIALWDNSTYLLSPPICTVNLSNGSAPTGQPVDVTWSTTGSLSQTIDYATYTGVITGQVVGYTGIITFIPPYNTITTIALHPENDVGINQSCSVQVTTTNTPPVISPGTTTGSEDAAQINGTLSGIDMNPGDSTFFAQFGATPLHGSVIVESSGSFQYYPNPDYCGIDTFEFRASDQFGNNADPVIQTLQIACINDAPIAINDTATGYAGVGFDINPVLNDTDVDSPYVAQTFAISSYTSPINGTLTLSGTTFSYTGNIGYSGADSFQYRIADQSGAISNTGTVNLAITIYNTTPTVTATGFTTNEDIAYSSILTGVDLEGDMLTFTASILPLYGTLVLASSGAYTYTPTANYFGSDSFVFRARDPYSSSTGALVSITINSVPDAPIAIGDTATVAQNSGALIPVLNNDTDVDSTVLTLTGYTNPLQGTIVVAGSGFLYTAGSGYLGTDSFTYRLQDDTFLLSNIATVNINVVSMNTAPVSSVLGYTFNEDTPLISSLSGSDAEFDTLTYTIDIFPTNGSLVVSSTGAFRYTPNINYFGSDNFLYHVSDASLSSTSSLVSLTISAINDLPLANATSYTVNMNSAISTGNTLTGILTGSDVETPILTFTMSTLPIHGSIILTSTGFFLYTPAFGYSGNDSFAFIVSDGVAQSVSATVTISIQNPTVVVPPPSGGGGNAGPGGGGGGGSSVANPTVIITPILTSAPEKKKIGGTVVTESKKDGIIPELHSAPNNVTTEFVLLDPTGLLGQLFLTNRILNASGILSVASPRIMTIFDTKEGLDDTNLGPTLLRKMLQIFVSETDLKDDPLPFYIQAIQSVSAYIFEEDSRLASTQKFILRILERNKKHYENIVLRDTIGRFKDTLDSASSSIPEGF